MVWIDKSAWSFYLWRTDLCSHMIFFIPFVLKGLYPFIQWIWPMSLSASMLSFYMLIGWPRDWSVFLFDFFFSFCISSLFCFWWYGCYSWVLIGRFFRFFWKMISETSFLISWRVENRWWTQIKKTSSIPDNFHLCVRLNVFIISLLYAVRININGYVLFLINTLDTIVSGNNMLIK